MAPKFRVPKVKMFLEAIVEQDGAQYTYRTQAYSFDQGKLMVRLNHNRRFGFVPEKFVNIISVYQVRNRLVAPRF